MHSTKTILLLDFSLFLSHYNSIKGKMNGPNNTNKKMEEQLQQIISVSAELQKQSVLYLN